MELLEQMIYSADKLAFCENPEQKQLWSNVAMEDIVYPPRTDGKYDEDIMALGVFYKMEPGAVITIELQDLLIICPRTRPRTDAYRGLVTELGRRGISLIVKSRKSK
jgi:hypothetical protein